MISFAVVVWFFAVAVPASAWVPLNVCPGGDEQTWESDTLTATISSLSWMDSPSQSAVAGAVTSWDDGFIGDSAMNVTTTVAAAPMIRGDDLNVVAVVGASGFTGLADIRGRDCSGFNELIECDVWLSSDLTWLHPSQYYDHRDQRWWDGEFFLDETLRHEVGHCLGLGHTAMLMDSERHLAAMNPFYGGRTIIGEREFIGIRRHYVSEDDREGMRALYPDSGVVTDIAAQSYFYDDTADYLLLCAVWARPDPPNDLQHDTFPICDPQVVSTPPAPLDVFPGAVFTTRFTALNLGTWDQTTVDARIVLTPEDNPNPTTFVVVDTFQIQPLSADLPLEIERTITVPSTILDATYYVVLQLDYGDAISEDDENNNEAFWNRQITVVGSPVGCSCDAVGSRFPWGVAVPVVLWVARRRPRR